MDEGGNTKDDLGLPKGTADADNLADQIKKDFDDGKELVVTVLKVRFVSTCDCTCLLEASRTSNVHNCLHGEIMHLYFAYSSIMSSKCLVPTSGHDDTLSACVWTTGFALW